jgi:putative Mn2+ efflux pump MntP
MSEAIVERTVNSVTDRRIVLTGSQMARTIAIGTNWTTLRFGMRLAIQGTTNFTPCRLFIGLCNGTTNLWGSQFCNHALGVLWGSDVTASTYSGTNPTNIFTIGLPMYYSKVSQTETKLTVTPLIGAGAPNIAADATTRNCFIGMQFRRVNSTSMALTLDCPNAAAGAANRTYDLCRDALLLPTMANVATQVGVTAGAEVTGAFDEAANGVLDSFHVYWQCQTTGIEFCDINAARIN